MLSSFFTYLNKIFSHICNFFATSKSEAHEPRTIKEFRELAESGNSIYQYKLACLLLNSPSENKDFAEISKWLISAANSGLKDANILLGLFSKDGYGMRINSEIAIRCFQNAAELGDSEALVHLAAMENEGTYTPKDPKILEEALRKAAQKGNPFAQFNLAFRLSKGPHDNLKEVTIWSRKAREGLQKIAGKDLVFAQYALGRIFQEGIGVPQNPEIALKWYKKAAKLGFAKAQFQAGTIILSGEVVPQNREEGINLLKKAEQQGLEIALKKLAELFPEEYISISGLDTPPVNATELFHKDLQQAQTNLLHDLSHMLLYEECLNLNYPNKPQLLSISSPSTFFFDLFLGPEFSNLKDFVKDPALMKILVERAYKKEDTYAQFTLGLIYYYGIEFPKNIPESLKLFKIAAERGNYLAQSFYGALLFLGRDIPQDFTEATKWFEKAGEQNDNSAKHNLAVARYSGCGLPQDKATAFLQFLKFANEYNFPFSQIAVGVTYLYGDDYISKNPEEACKYLRLVEEHNLAIAYFYLGICYIKGEGVSQDPYEAVEYFKKAALPDWGAGLLFMGAIYSIGFCVPKDIEKGYTFFQEAMQQDVARAKIFLGILSALGLRPPDQSFDVGQLFKDTAESGDDFALYNLGIWYLIGTIVPQDPKEAVKCFQKAADIKNVYAQNLLGLMFTLGIGVSPDPVKAYEMFLQAAEKGHTNAQFNLSVMYFEGLGVPQNLEKWILWLHKAASSGHVDAQYILGTLYFVGKYVPKDTDEAFKWFLKAANQGDARAKRQFAVHKSIII
ncbi:MAG: sel1 repeat family protein [Deltaproteobacteria bacterium]|nr:sel1 repeat family protein [Deltaproteobacteria bacterium]